MDFQSQGEDGLENAELAQDGGNPAPPAAARATGAQVLTPNAQGVVVLPQGVSLDDIQVQGRDLVIVAENGVRYVIPDGAIVVPQIVIDGVVVPPVNLAALLLGNEPQPAAGNTQSSGGNFAGPVGSLQDAFGLGDLLPYTELAFPEPEERELLPDLADRDPDVVIEDGGVASRDVSDEVREAGLPGTRPNGNVESPGSAAGNNAHVTDGTIIITAPDGLASVTINGITVTGTAGQQITTPQGTLTLGALANGEIPYTYVLADNTSGDSTTDMFTVVVTDTDGDSATARLTIDIIDDVPTARNDTDTTSSGGSVATGNVITGADTTSGSAGADTRGADNANLSGIAAGTGSSFTAVSTGGATIAGTHGSLTINPDGSYTYTKNPIAPGGATDVFTYRLTDGDGDTSTATLTISLPDAPVTIISVPTGGAGTIVDEAGLPPRPNEPPGSEEPTSVETTAGTITFSAPDGVASVTLDGVVITGPNQQIDLPVGSPIGTLTIISYDPVGGTINYSFTLDDNTAGDNTQVDITVVVTDTDGDNDSADFSIIVIDDVPEAADDSASPAEDTPVIIDVFANDISGADDVDLANDLALGTGPTKGTVVYNNDGTFTYTPNGGAEGTDSFTYSITDGDGDVSTATVTITLAADSTPTIRVTDGEVDEAALSDGSNPQSGAETDTGTFTITTGNDTIDTLVINGTDVTGGGTVTGTHGTLTVTFAAGAYSWSYELTDNTLDHPDDTSTGTSEGIFDTFSVEITDSDGDTDSDTLIIDVLDDGPDAIDDTAASVAEDAVGTIGGNVRTNDTQGADDATVTSVNIGGTDYAVAAVGVTNVATANGAYTFTAAGAWTFNPNTGLNNAAGIDASFSYTLTDGDGDFDTATQPITVTDGALPVAGAPITLVVDDENLANGSSPAVPVTDADTITFTPGSDAIASIVFGTDLSGLGGGLTWTRLDGDTIVGADGPDTIVTLQLGVAGNVATVTATLSNNYDSHPDINVDDLADLGSVGVVATDIDGDTATGTVNVSVSDDLPDAIDDTAASVAEDAVGTIGGNVRTNDTQGADDATVTSVNIGGTDYAVAAVGVTNVATANGAYTFTAAGAWTFNPNTGLNNAAGIDASFSYTLTDGDGDFDTATQPITVTDGALPVAGAPITLVVDDENLANGSSPAVPVTDADTITFTPGSDAIASIVFGTDLSGLGGGLTWTRLDGDTIVGADGPDTIVTLQLGVAGNVATVTATLSNNYDSHPDINVDDLADLGSVGVVATDIDGDTATGTVNVSVSDDLPDAIDDTAASVAEDAVGTIGGNVRTNDTQGADDATVTSVNIGGTDYAVAAVGVTNVATANGAYTFTAAGAWTFNPNTGLNNAAGIDASFSYTLTDGDGDFDTATQPITVTDGALPVAGAPITLVVDDENLANGSSPAVPVTDADTITFTPGSDAIASIVFGTDLSGLGGGLTWTRLDGDTIVGADGPDTIVTLQLGVAGNVATVTATLSNNYDSHPDINVDDLADLGSVGVVATDIDGDTATGTVNVSVSDDLPDAIDDTAASVAEDAVGTIGGNVRTNDTQGADDATVTSVNIGGTDYAVAAVGVTNVATANGAYTFTAAGAWTFNPNTGLNNAAGIDASFSYTLTDGDGDFDTATQPITVTDGALPVAGAPITLVVDDENLANGSSPAVPVTDADTITFTPGSDAIASIVFGTDLSGLGGGLTWTRLDGDTIVGADGPDTIVTLQLGVAGNVATVTATLSNNYDSHPDINVDDLADLGSVGVVATDIDGDTATGTVNVSVSDDLPDAIDDTAASVAEDAVGTIGGNVRTNDTQGADDATVTSVNIGGTDYAVAAVGVTNVATANGAYTFTAAGAWTFNPNTGLNNAAGIDASFSYTLTDGDGDFDTATQPITVTDGALPVAGAPITLVVDDENLANGSSPAVPVTDADTITFTPGSDAIASIVFGTDLSGLGGGLTWTRLDGDTIVGAAGPDTIVTLQLGVAGNVATVTATLSNNYDSHPDINVDDLADLGSVGVVATDIDGDTATGTVNVSVSDDLPDAIDDTAASVAEDAVGTIGGNVRTNDTQGADDATVTSVNIGGTDYAVAAVGVTNVATANGAYTFTAAGAWTFNPNTGLNNAAGIDASFSYTLTDGDGDFDTATQPITVTDGALPVAGAPITLVVDDENLANGSSPAVPVTDADTITFTPGSDAIASIVFGTDLSGLGGGLTWTRLDGDTIVGADGPDTIVTLQLGVAGNVATVTATLSNNYDSHPDINVDDLADLGSVGVVATDIDGDTATGTVNVSVSDDVPHPIVTQNGVINNVAGATGTFDLDNDGNVDNNAGADQGASVTFQQTLEGPTGLTSNGAQILYHVSSDGKTLIATTSAIDPFLNLANTTAWVFKVDLLEDNSLALSNDDYTVTMYASVDSRSVVDFTEGGYDFLGGNTHWIGFVPLGEEATPLPNLSSDLLLTPIVNGDTANGNANEMGSGGAGGGSLAVGPGQGLRLDFVRDLTGDPTSGGGGYVGPSNHDFSGHYTVPGVSIEFAIGGNASNRSTIEFAAWTDTDTGNPDAVGEAVTLEQISSVIITFGAKTATLLDDAQFTIDTTTVGTDQYTYLGTTYTVTKNADGTVSVEGVANGATVAVFTDGAFTTLEARHDGGAEWTITGIATSVLNNQPITLALPIELADGDGDISQSHIDLTFKPPTGTQQGANLTATVAEPNLLGTDGDDTLTGNSGVNWISGGRGADQLTGGAGADTFVIDPSHLTAATDDTITDYAPAVDLIDLRALFDAMGTLAPTTAVEAAAVTRLVGNQLQVDADGTGAGTTFVTVATLSNNPASVNVLWEFNQTFITENATPPIILDLDGDGVEFAGVSGGTTFDYDGDGSAEATAWAGADDGILAIDLNGDGQVTDGSEVVFGSDGLTDLQGLAASYDSNADGVLDAQDAAFAQFGVLQGGTFVSLSDAGIVSVGLTTDGQSYTAANGDVVVHGTGTFTRTDGSTGLLADAAFATAPIDRRTAEVATTAAVATALLVPIEAAATDLAPTDEALEAVLASTIFEAADAPVAEIDEPASRLVLAETSDEDPSTLAEQQTSPARTEPDVAATSDDVADDMAEPSPAGQSSEFVADFSSSDSPLQADEGGALMEALLAFGDAPQDAVATRTDGAVAVEGALADLHGEALVDTIVDHFAGLMDGAAADGSEKVLYEALADTLDTQLFFAGAGQAPDPVEDAANLAAAAQG